MYTTKGTIKVINPTQVISEKFSKREFIIETSDQYPQQIMLQLTQDKCDYLEVYQLGQQVDVSFNLRGREWTSPSGEVKYFNTLEAWKIEKVGSEPAQEQPKAKQPTTTPTNEEEDDLPF